MNAPLELVPPPGPLAWLHPELRGECGGAAPFPYGEALVEQARAASAVRIEDGPRGATVRRFLRERLRGSGISIELDPARPSFERRLLDGAAAVRGPAVPPLLVLDGDDAERSLETALARLERGAARPLPLFRTRLPARDAADPAFVATRLRESWFGLLPGEDYHDSVRTLWHELLRRLHPGRRLRYLALEEAALAGFDLFDEVVRGRADALREGTPESARGGARVFAVEGIDGAGKSTHVAQLAAHLAAKGLRVATHKLFRHGVFHETVTDLTRQCEGGARLHLWPLQRVVKCFDSLKHFHSNVAADLAAHDAVVFDRWVPTHLAEGIGRCHHDPFARELLAALPRPDRVFLLDLPETDALARLDARAARTVDENPYMLGRYRASLLELARRDGHVVLDARAPLDANQRRMRDEVDRLLAGVRA